MPRFAVLSHDWPAAHWDFLLEDGPTLRAWRLRAEPRPGAAVPAEPNADHRLLYLDYEGPVSGGRGSVRRWDAGTFAWVEREPVVVELWGERLTGVVRFGEGEDGRLIWVLSQPGAGAAGVV